MNLPRIEIHGHLHYPQSALFHISRHSLSPKSKLYRSVNPLPASSLSSQASFSPSKPNFRFSHVRVSNIEEAPSRSNEEKAKNSDDEDLTADGEVYKKTLRLVECSMFAALGGLAYILSSSLAIEVATATLLLVLSGPLKALTYLLMYGLLGLTMGSLWRLRASWGLSIVLSAIVRAMGATGYVVMYSFLIRENILALITINIHASLTYILSSLGFIAIPSMNTIYAIFGILLLINCGVFVFLLHLLYSVFFTRLGMKGSLRLPGWLEKAI